MDLIKTMVRATPNPYAKKIICNFDVKARGKVSFNGVDECTHVPLALALFQLPEVTQIHFFENVVTITQSGNIAWDDLVEQAKKVIINLLPQHDPDFESAEHNRRKGLPTEILQIEEILDRTIRPALQGDGGDLEVLDLDGHLLTIRYEGACGSCPSAATGTLSAIQSVLRDEYDPELEVIPIMLETH
ncbi:NifU family protein [Pseudobacteriovorax antillogorgiicola]|uniref:Fe-S cluster biogenesis protein NfuA, 4Fe-4S-binding domain n=1 Tax=Pseudobacteriovorax antillogorgiicola TaxID=1513793 RepID=A0A1Y6C868_9BACT|nr:NifU family protein [Pseudobacteriovorax antillogorgiicola]TCS49382.1 Fe-S cluster biogenesis protein NfuA [Pseudobacteriovorax antillogorgiicola]SMF47299.1 Fe-S cluster biogenesis protein NfuA, 4Fe-4S-binding domain [Pseudobacteriovorax antillogorgiicola]